MIVFVCIVGWAALYIYKGREAATPEGAARILIGEVGDVPDEVLPHTVDQATEFKDSLKYLKSDIAVPDYRETVTALKVVEAEVAPTLRENIEVEGVQITSEVKVDRAIEAESEQVAELEADSTIVIPVNRDWKGVVLIPDSVQMARAYSTSVRMSRIEAHPLDGGLVRVWSRIENLTAKAMRIETACEFRFVNRRAVLTPFRSLWIPAGGAIDVDFLSQFNRVNAYTLMVK